MGGRQKGKRRPGKRNEAGGGRKGMSWTEPHGKGRE